MSNTKSNYIFNLLLTIVNLIFPILSFPYASRILGPIGIGQVQFITSFAQYFALVAALGIPIYGIREIAKVQNNEDELKKTFSELLIIFVITSIVLSIIYLISIFFINNFKADRAYYQAALPIVLLGFCSLDWFYSGIEKFKLIAIRSVIVKILSLILLYTFISTPSDSFKYLLISCFSIVGNNVISMALVWKDVKITFKDLHFRRHFKALTLIFSTSLASSMYTLFDVVILGFLSTKQAVGYYSAGVKLVKITIPFVTSLGAVMIPKISFNLGANNLKEFYSLLSKSFSFIAFISIPITFGLFLLSREGILLFSGPEFLPAQIVMQILALMPIVIGFGYFFGIQVLISTGKDRQMLISVSIGMLVSLAINLLLIPKFGEIGAAVANILSELFVTLAYIFFVRRLYHFEIPYRTLLYTVVASLPFIPIVWLGHKLPLNMLLQTAVIFIACTTTYFAIQYLIFKNELATASVRLLVNKVKSISI